MFWDTRLSSMGKTACASCHFRPRTGAPIGAGSRRMRVVCSDLAALADHLQFVEPAVLRSSVIAQESAPDQADSS
jgi:cytochrome c peroxidase